MILAFFICVIAFFPTWFFGTMTANLLGIQGAGAGLFGFVFALAVMFAFGRFLLYLTRPRRQSPAPRPDEHLTHRAKLPH